MSKKSLLSDSKLRYRPKPPPSTTLNKEDDEITKSTLNQSTVETKFYITDQLIFRYGNYSISFFLLAYLYRVCIALTTKTYFAPDEFWQAWEVAHRLVYNYGYLTWEWEAQIRSFIYPALTAGIFYLLKLLHLDSYFMLMTIPKLIHSVFAATCDYYTVLLGIRFFGAKVKGWAMFFTLTSWLHFFMSTRAFPNVPEMTLTTVALYYWPWSFLEQVHSSGFEVALILAAISCILRPTAAIPWLYLGIRLILNRDRKISLPRIAFSTATIMSLALLFQISVDYLFFKSWLLVPYRFYKFNVAQQISAFYGVSESYFYIFLGIPALLATFLPFMWFGSSKPKTELLVLTGVIVGIYSLLPHKELRLIYVILPPLLIIAANGLALKVSRSKYIQVWGLILVLTQLPVGMYLNQIHQRGVVDVVDWLRQQEELKSVGFLMPCHSTPFHAQLHREIPMWFITCRPPLNDQPAFYMDTSDKFYDSPSNFLQKHISNDTLPLGDHRAEEFLKGQSVPDYNYFWPSHVVFFEALLQKDRLVLPLLNELGYQPCFQTFNSHFHDDPRRRGLVLVYCR